MDSTTIHVDAPGNGGGGGCGAQYMNNSSCAATRTMLDHHRSPPVSCSGTSMIAVSGATGEGTSDVVSRHKGRQQQQQQQNVQSHQLQQPQSHHDEQSYPTSHGNGGCGASSYFDGAAPAPSHGEDVPYFVLDERTVPSSAPTAVGVDTVASGGQSYSCQSQWPASSSSMYGGWRGAAPRGEPGVHGVGGIYTDVAFMSAQEQYQPAWGYPSPSVQSPRAGSIPTKHVHGGKAASPPPQDLSALAVASRTMAAAGRLPAILDTTPTALPGLSGSSNTGLFPAFLASGVRPGGGGQQYGTSSCGTNAPGPGLGFLSTAQRGMMEPRSFSAGYAGNGYTFSDRGPLEDEKGGSGSSCQNGSMNTADDEKILTPEEKLERSRIRNRDHSRKSRQRKKALVEGMKKQVSELGAYRMLVEQAHDLISAHSVDDRALFLYASGAFQRLLEINPQDLLGVQLVHMVHPDDVLRVTEALRSALLYNEVVQVRYRFRHHSRGDHLVETSFRLIPTRLLAVTRANGPTFHTTGARH